MAATCYQEEEPVSSFLSYGLGDGVGWLSQAVLSESAFSLNISPSLASLSDAYVGLVWESRRACQAGDCGHVMYGTNAAQGFPLKTDLSAAAPTDPGYSSPSIAVDDAGRVNIAFERIAGGASGEIFVVHSEEVTVPSGTAAALLGGLPSANRVG